MVHKSFHLSRYALAIGPCWRSHERWNSTGIACLARARSVLWAVRSADGAATLLDLPVPTPIVSHVHEYDKRAEARSLLQLCCGSAAARELRRARVRVRVRFARSRNLESLDFTVYTTTHIQPYASRASARKPRRRPAPLLDNIARTRPRTRHDKMAFSKPKTNAATPTHPPRAGGRGGTARSGHTPFRFDRGCLMSPSESNI